MIGTILFAVTLYVFTTELWLFVTRRSRRAVLRRTTAAGSGGRSRLAASEVLDLYPMRRTPR
jgi:uncharacterized membrane protein